MLSPYGADLILGALADVQPVDPANDPVGIVATRLIAPFLRL